MAQPDWCDRTIRGPVAEYLSAQDFGRLFGFSADTVRRLTADGEIPPPIQMTKQSMLYTWEHVVYFTLRTKFRPSLVAAAGAGDAE